MSKLLKEPNLYFNKSLWERDEQGGERKKVSWGNNQMEMKGEGIKVGSLKYTPCMCVSGF